MAPPVAESTDKAGEGPRHRRAAPALDREKRDDLGGRSGILRQEQVAALVATQFAVCDPRCDRLGVGLRCETVVAPAGHQRRTADLPETRPDVVVSAGLQL